MVRIYAFGSGWLYWLSKYYCQSQFLKMSKNMNNKRIYNYYVILWCVQNSIFIIYFNSL